MRRKFLHSILTLTVIAFLMLAASSAALAHPVPYPPPGETYPPVPEPSPVPSANGFKEEDTRGNISSFGGLDSNGLLIAAGYAGDDNGIRFYNGNSWNGFNTNFTPTGMEWSKNDNTILFVSDNESNIILKGTNLTQTGADWIEIGSQGSDPGQFIDPHGMFTTDNDELYVVDTGNNRIQMWDGFEWVQVSSPQYSEYMVDICIFENTTYITDNSRNCIYYKTPEETGWNIIVNPTYINYPSYMDIDEDGNIYFLSWVIYPDGPQKNIVRFSNGTLSVFVESGNGPGFLSNEPSSEELCITDYGGLLYSDSSSGKLYREMCNDNTIRELTVNGIQIGINDIDTTYEISIDDSIDECIIEAIPNYSAALIEGTGKFQLNAGSNSIILTCTSETGTSRQYNLDVIRDLSGNASLSGIMIDGLPLQGFESDIYIYENIGCSLEQETMEITGIPVNPEALMIGSGIITLSIGENPVLLTVISQNGINIHYYLLNITRSDAESDESPIPSPTSSPAPSASPEPAATQTPVPTSSPTSSPVPSDGPEVPVNVDPTETPPIDRTPTPTPEFRTPNPWQEDTEKDFDKEIEKDIEKNRIKQIIIAAVAAVGAAAGILSYIFISKRKKRKNP